MNTKNQTPKSKLVFPKGLNVQTSQVQIDGKGYTMHAAQSASTQTISVLQRGKKLFLANKQDPSKNFPVTMDDIAGFVGNFANGNISNALASSKR